MAAEASASRSESSTFEIIGVRTRHGQFRKAVPTMPLALAIFCCLLNVALPGTGTLVSAFAVCCHCPTEYDNISEAVINNLIAAFLQMLTLILVIGYIWSILWGVTFISLSSELTLDLLALVVTLTLAHLLLAQYPNDDRRPKRLHCLTRPKCDHEIGDGFGYSPSHPIHERTLIHIDFDIITSIYLFTIKLRFLSCCIKKMLRKIFCELFTEKKTKKKIN